VAKGLKVRGLKVGTSTVRVKVAGLKALTVKVTVVATKVKATKVAISAKSKTLAAGKSQVLAAKVKPSAATGVVPVWSSSTPAVATVDATGKVTAKQKGSTKITVTVAGAKATITLKVK
jgi:alpha-amylase